MEGKWWWMALVLLAALSSQPVESCSCVKEHPQTHYCQSDFVVVATVRRLMKSTSYESVYKLKIRKEFKMSEKARVALKSGRLITAKVEELCGRSLQLNTTYLITGRVISLQAHLNLCNYVEPWRDVTPRQRKGFRMLYKQGCPCRINKCHSRNECDSKAKHICRWAHPFDNLDCHSPYGICLINKDGLCHWARAPRLTECLRKTAREELAFNA